MGRTALILGGSGLVGGHLLARLMFDPAWERVVALRRGPLGEGRAKLESHGVNFDRPESYAHLVKGDDVFCCLGTTIRAAGSKEAFRKVDYQYPLDAARAAAKNGCRTFSIVTSLGADPRSRVFYNRTKGDVEAAIRALPLKSVRVFRPSLLLGHRPTTRLGERAGEVLLRLFGPALIGPLRKYRAIEGRAVAAAMVLVAKEDPAGPRVYESDAIQALADRVKS